MSTAVETLDLSLQQSHDNPTISGDGQVFALVGSAGQVYRISHGQAEIGSRAIDGSGANGASSNPRLNADGTRLMFDSQASNLVADDGNGSLSDVFMRDFANASTELISRTTAGSQGNGPSIAPSASDDGVRVAFATSASNLSGVSGASSQIVLSQRSGSGRQLSLISRNPVTGEAGNGPSREVRLTPDGRFGVFVSAADNLVAGDSNGVDDVFLFELGETGLTRLQRISLGPQGNQANAASQHASISADGSYVAFASDASNLVLLDRNQRRDVFVKNIATGEVLRMSASVDGQVPTAPEVVLIPPWCARSRFGGPRPRCAIHVWRDALGYTRTSARSSRSRLTIGREAMLAAQFRVRMLAMLAGAGLAFCASSLWAQPISVAGELAPATEKSAVDFAARMPDFPEAATVSWAMPKLADERAQQVRENNSRQDSKRLQIGVERALAEESHLTGTPNLEWRSLPDGAHVARLAMSSPGAAALRLGLAVSQLPERAELRFFGDGQTQSVVAAVGRAEIERIGTELYWTPVTEGVRQTIEFYLPAGTSPSELQFRVDRVAHLLASPYGSLDGLKIGESQPCEIDANCVANPSTAYTNSKNAVARMSYQSGGQSFVCTGTLLNDTDSSTSIPYFFSANHCMSTQVVANTLTTFWFEESTSCGSGIASARTQVSGGAALLYNNANTDILLLRLNNAAPSGAYFAGWSSTPVTAGTNILVLHHPAGDVKKVSQGQITGFGTFNGAGDFIQAGYTAGTTEGGSSGSGLLTFNGSEYQVRGGLFGGSASCSNSGNINNPDNRDSYSRFDAAIPFLAPFLSPSTSTPQALQNGVPVTGLSGAAGAALAFTIAIPAGAQNLVVSTSGGTGDPDLYVRFGSPPTTSTFDCRSFATGPTEQCTFATPSAGTYHVLVSGFSAFSGLSLSASWQTQSGGGGAVDEPSFTAFPLPIPTNFPGCPAGYFVATVTDGPGAGLSPGIFGLAFQLDAPGTQRLEGGLNFGGLVDGSQAAFAGFNFQNPANEPQRLNLIMIGAPSSDRTASLPVRIKVIRQPAPNVNEVVLETTTSLTIGTQYTRSIDLTPAYYVVTVAPEGAASVPGGAADGEVYVSATTQFVDRPGGGFFAGAVVGGYHAAHPFGGVSGYAAICLGDQHSASARVLSAPTYGAAGARDLRLKLLDAQDQVILSVPN